MAKVFNQAGEEVHFKITQGATFAESITIHAAWTVTAAQLQIRPNEGHPTLLAERDESDGITITNGASSVGLGITWTAAETAALDWGTIERGRYNLFVTRNTGAVESIMSGYATLVRSAIE